MAGNELRYQQRIVAFLDVLGFENRLCGFEKEVLGNRDEGKSNEGIVSKGANEFVAVFKNVTGLIDQWDCRYYLFSDNICITVDPYHNKQLAIDLFFIISDLFKKFSEMGYFLRGGIDYGWMLDENDIVLGIPLVNAYQIENSVANYPRIVLSCSYKEFLDALCESNEVPDNYIFNKENFLNRSCEITYLNTFYNVIRNDDKITFFSTYKSAIENQMIKTKQNEKYFLKYEWLASEYNKFLKYYIQNCNYIDQERQLDDDEIKKLISLKIENHAE